MACQSRILNMQKYANACNSSYVDSRYQSTDEKIVNNISFPSYKLREEGGV